MLVNNPDPQACTTCILYSTLQGFFLYGFQSIALFIVSIKLKRRIIRLRQQQFFWYLSFLPWLIVTITIAFSKTYISRKAMVAFEVLHAPKAFSTLVSQIQKPVLGAGP